MLCLLTDNKGGGINPMKGRAKKDCGRINPMKGRAKKDYFLLGRQGRITFFWVGQKMVLAIFF